MAHNLGLWAIASGFVSGCTLDDPRLRCTAFGKELKNPLGLAAGFDKNGVAADKWEAMGFGFAEIGTVTPLPQPGNPKPRLFRLPADEALINRLGFNNKGAEDAARNLEAAQTHLPIGVNIGKGRETPLELASEDYAAACRRLAPLADYVVVNVSSPNTPGLRNLQALANLRGIVERLETTKPLFVKVSPDQDDKDLATIAEFAAEHSLGIVATNTTTDRAGLNGSRSDEAGGLSGRPLKSRAVQVCRLVRGVAPGIEIIGVGGIFTGQDLYDRLRAGATACQIYSALVYRGPCAAELILAELLECMERDGVQSLAEL